MRLICSQMGAFFLLANMACQGVAGETPRDPCIAPLSYLPLDPGVVGADDNGLAALGTYERISPDGRFILRSYSGAKLGQVSLIELPQDNSKPLQIHQTPLANEAFPVQGTWRYLVNVNGQHYRLNEILNHGNQAKPLLRGGMTGFYAAASEMQSGTDPASPMSDATIHLRSLSWPQHADPDQQGIGPLQLATLQIHDDGKHARITHVIGPQFICNARVSVDGNAFALPMISVDGTEFSAIPQAPRVGQPSMRIYRLSAKPTDVRQACEPLADLGHAPSKAVFGFPSDDAPARLTYSDLGHVHVFDRALGHSWPLDHGRHRVLASAFPGLTRDGRVIYGATWELCNKDDPCLKQAGYVVADPYQSLGWRQYWERRGEKPPKACITAGEVRAERLRFARFHGLAP